MAMMFAWTLNAQVDTIVTASGELGNSGSDLEFLNESGGLTRFPRLSDAGELLYYPPLVATDSVTNITSTSAMIYGNILFNGWYENVQEQGFQLSTTADFSGSVTTQAITPDNPYSDCELPCMENVYSFIFIGLTPTTTYYVRAYAANEQGTAYGDTLPFTTLFGCGISTVQDYDGNVYNTVQIGRQCWTKENLKTTHYMNGTAIPPGNRYNPNNDAANVATYGYLYNWPAVMNGDASSNAIPSGVQGICPTGWHVPSDAEWKQMEMAVGMSQSDADATGWRGSIAARLCGNMGWQSSSTADAAGNISATGRNSSGFSALPAGNYSGSYDNFGANARFWSATENSNIHAWLRYLGFNYAGVHRAYTNKGYGYSVRCVHDMPVSLGELPIVTTNIVTDITYTTATCGGNVVYEGNSAVTVRGVCWSTSENPTVGDSHTEDGSGQGSFVSTLTNLTAGTTYHVRAYAINSTDTVYGEEMRFTSFACGISTVTDYNSNTYNTVQIGSQCWTKENLKTTHYMNGTAIPLGSTASTTVAYRYNPNNDAANVATYGYLYNWPAVMNGEASPNTIHSGVQGICPDGWHVPRDREWQEMEFAAGMSASDTVRQQFRGNIVARLCGNTGWSSSSVANAAGNTSAENRNSTGFSICPAGYYNAASSEGVVHEAEFWTASMYNSDSSFRRDCFYTNVGINRTAFNKNRGFSVRCVHDIPVPLGDLPLVTTNIVTDITSTTATCGGNVVYEGSSAVTARGVCWSTLENPTVEDSHTEDGSGQGSFVSTLTNLTAGTTYHVRAYAINSADTVYGETVSFVATIPQGAACGTCVDYDGNTYGTIQIGSQCWMKENLKTTHYADGTGIASGSAHSYSNASRWCYPGDNSSNKANYGLLYSWSAMMRSSSSSSNTPSGVQGICPTGWHVPSDAEWTQLTNYVSSQNNYLCSSSSSSIAKSLASKSNWNSCSSSCTVGNNPSDNNATGFNAKAAGRGTGGGISISTTFVYLTNMGKNAYFMSATANGDDFYGRIIGNCASAVSRDGNLKKNEAYSVRCVKD